MKRGIFIAIEGGDGSGKDTQIGFLKDMLGDRALVTRVPGGTPLGEEIRNIAVHESLGPVSLPAEMFLFLADRAEQLEKVIRPALEEGMIVLANRSWLSLIAYQIYGRDRFEWKEFVDLFIDKMFKEVPLDLAIVLDQSPEVGIERLRAQHAGKLDAIEAMPLENHERVRRGFLDAAKQLPHAVIVDAARSKEEVWKDVKAAVESVLN
jgi:dTMP kinase